MKNALLYSLGFAVLTIASVTSSAAQDTAYVKNAESQTGPSLYLDQVIPGRASVDLFDALKAREYSELYIRPRSFKKKPLRPVYKFAYVNNFEECNKFDDGRTLYQDILGYKLDADWFDKDSTVELFMDDVKSAEFLNGECLLGNIFGDQAPEADYSVAYKPNARNYVVVSTDSEKLATIDTLDLSIPTIQLAINGKYVPIDEEDWKPRVTTAKANKDAVSDANIIRALNQGNRTFQHVAIFVLRERIGRYFGNGVEISEKPQSKDILNTLLVHDFLKDDDEITRASLLQSLAAVVQPEDSAKAKTAIITAMDTEYPFTMDKADRQNGARFGIEYPADGTERKGHQSQKITLGTAVLLQLMSDADRNEIIARYPESYEKLFTGLYKSMGGTVALRKMIRGK